MHLGREHTVHDRRRFRSESKHPHKPQYPSQLYQHDLQLFESELLLVLANTNELQRSGYIQGASRIVEVDPE